jgi:hypothetical protein
MILHEYLYKYLLQIILFRDAADTFFFHTIHDDYPKLSQWLAHLLELPTTATSGFQGKFAHPPGQHVFFVLGKPPGVG